MTLTHTNPPDTVDMAGVSQVVVATGSRHVYVSGQAPLTADGTLVGEGDLRTQTKVALENLLVCLASVGASYGDIVRATLYVVDYGPESLDAIYGAAYEVIGDGLPPTALTLIGVAALFLPGQLFEIDAIAVLA